MENSGSATAFEVYCPRCNVSFAVGSKKCLHCGSRLSAQRGHPGLVLPPEAEEMMAEAEAPSRGRVSPLTLMWIVLLLGGYLYRACTSG